MYVPFCCFYSLILCQIHQLLTVVAKSISFLVQFQNSSVSRLCGRQFQRGSSQLTYYCLQTWISMNWNLISQKKWKLTEPFSNPEIYRPTCTIPIHLYSSQLKPSFKYIYILILMIKSFYSPKIIAAELALLSVSALSLHLILSVQQIHEYFFSSILQGVIYVGEASLALGIMIAIDFQGAVVVLYLFKLMLQASSQSLEAIQILVPAVFYYLVFKIGCIAVVKVKKIQTPDHKNVKDKSLLISNQQQIRLINLSLLFATSLLLLNHCLAKTNAPLAAFLILLVNLTCVVIEIYIMNTAEENLFKLISNSLSYNLYSYFLQNLLLGRIFYSSYLSFMVPTIASLLLCLAFIRAFIGAKSYKFHKTDENIFNAAYIFKGSSGYKYYRSSSNSDRTFRVLDRISREIATIIYFVSFFTSISSDSYIYFLTSVILVMSYPIHQQKTFQPIQYLKQKLNINISFKLKLTLPIIILFYRIITKSPTRKQYLYDQINNCAIAHYCQIIFMGIIFCGVFFSQLLPIKIKYSIFRGVELICPLIVLGWVVWIECVHFKLILLGTYVLALCFEIIRQGDNAQTKGNKRE